MIEIELNEGLELKYIKGTAKAGDIKKYDLIQASIMNGDKNGKERIN